MTEYVKCKTKGCEKSAAQNRKSKCDLCFRVFVARNKEYMRVYRIEYECKNKEKILERKKKKDKLTGNGKASSKRSYEKLKQDPERYKKFQIRQSESKKDRRLKNLELHRARDRKYHSKRKDRKSVTNKEWRSKNKEKMREYNKNWFRERFKKDPSFKIAWAVRIRVVKVLKRLNTSKSNSTLNLIGCSREDLLNHLSSKFSEGMTIENHGLWHIDHIRPLSSFDLTDHEEQKKAFHYTNLQPLWAIDNIKKSDKWKEQHA